MKTFILGLVLIACTSVANVANAQPVQPASGVAKCYIPFYITVTGAHAPGNTVAASNGFDNRQDGCSNWILYYSNVGFATVSLLVESAPSAANNVHGTYVAFAGTVVTGANPSTSTTQCGINCLTMTGYYPYVRMTATLTGSGAVVGVLLGDPTPASNISPITATVTGIIDENLKQINGTTVSQGNGVAGLGTIRVTVASDNTNIPTVNGATSTALADALSNTANLPTFGSAAGTERELPFKFNGASWDRDFICTNQASFNLSGSGNTQIIAASGSTTVRICHISFSTTASEDIKITQGTGSNCGSGTADVTGLYKSVLGLALDFSPTAALRGSASQAICINQSLANATGGVVVYAQY